MHFFKCLLKVQKVINKTVKKLTFNFFRKHFVYGFNVNCLVSAQHLKIQERFFFFVIVKNEKLMDVKVHGPMQYTGTEFFFSFCLYACFI